MQDAWVVDQGTEGAWTNIGYVAPTSKNVTYTEGSGATAWQAGPTTANWNPCGCSGDDAWKIGVSVSGTTATYTPSTDCTTLTPNFTSIGTSN